MNFPTSPALNDTYSLGSKTWKWNGVAWDLQSTGLTSSMVVAALGFTPYNAASLSTDLAPYLTSSTAASTYQTALGFTPLNKAGDTMTGNLAFSGTGLRINGDFSNATMSSRTLFQSSTANGNTQIGAIPNGTAVNSAFFTYNNSDPTNASTGILRINASEVALISGITGTGSYLPLVFLTNNLERARFDTSGNWGVGTSAPKVRAQFSAGSAVNAPTLGTAGGVAYFTNNDAAYGLLVGTSAVTGAAWFQAQRTDTTATAYDILLNPAGGNVTIGAGFRQAKVAVASTAIDLSLGSFFTKTISGATTFTVSNVPTTGTAASFILDLTNGGSGTITWWSGVKWAGGTAPTLTSSGRDVLGFFTHDGGTTWTGLVLAKDAK